ncbi:DUF2177 family protein [bacterium]|jgi:uncharacterized membrane protein|nr:DUF2177 family protein [bacterium]
MTTQLKQFLLAALSFIVLDFLWLGFVVKKFNLRQLSEIGRIENGDFKILYTPALIVYVLMGLAVTMFVLPRLEAGNSVLKDFWVGAALGLMVYGVYDMTNLAILKNYPVQFALADMAWGTFVFGAVTVVVKKLV